jgi:hypothetical protein
MPTFILFLIAFVALSTIGLWGKYIVAGIILACYVVPFLLAIGFIAFIVSSVVQNAGKPIGSRTAAQEQELERTWRQIHPEAPGEIGK